LDVIEGRRDGQSPFYFSANNGREPLYIYLTTLFVAMAGQTPEAVRIGAAVVGTLTTIFVYLLAETWFGKRVGILSAFVWAITVWPLHLSRIGLRPILLPLMITICFWLGTLAYRKAREGNSSIWLWILSGIAYGLAFYTYLAARFTPILLAALVIYLIVTKRHKPLWPGVLWFALGAFVTLIPFTILLLQQPDLVAGRLDQVSILSPEINDGSIIGTFITNTFLAFGMFVVKGDTILRHNPSGRAVSQLWSWSRLPSHLGKVLVIGLSLASLGLTIKDYFVDYGPDAETGYWFEAAARSLAEDLNQNNANGELYMDRRFSEGWPSVLFLTESIDEILKYRPDELNPDTISRLAFVYAWPHENLEKTASAIASPALLDVTVGDMAKGDLDPEPYPLYVRYSIGDPLSWPILASFDNTIQLRFADLKEIEDGRLQVDLSWSTLEPVDASFTAFVHLLEGDDIVAQSDSVPGSGYWPSQWWRPGLVIQDSHILNIEKDYNRETQQITIGLYNTRTLEPLPMMDPNGNPIGEAWILQ